MFFLLPNRQPVRPIKLLFFWRTPPSCAKVSESLFFSCFLHHGFLDCIKYPTSKTNGFSYMCVYIYCIYIYL